MNAPLSKPRPKSLLDALERRARRAVKLGGHAIRKDGSAAKVTVVDLSYDGCGVECGAELLAGESVKLLVSKLGGINAQVRWCTDGKAGLVFDAVQPPAKGKAPRRSKRILTVGQVSIRRRGGLSSRVPVFDASLLGCRLELLERAQLEEHVWVRFEGLQPLEAKVCWVDGHRCGIQFVTPIHPSVFDLLLQNLRHRPEK